MEEKKIDIYINDAEEVPTNVNKRVKVLETPVFSFEDKRRIERLLDQMEHFQNADIDQGILESVKTSLAEINRRDSLLVSVLKDIRDSLASINMDEMRQPNEDISALKDDNARIIAALSKLVEGIEAYSSNSADIASELNNFKEHIAALESRVDEKLDSTESSVNYIKGMIIDATDRMKDASSGEKLNALVAGISEKFDAYAAAINSRIDGIGSAENNEAIVRLAAKIDDVKESFDTTTLRLMDEKIESIRNIFDESALNKINEKIDSIRSAYDMEAVKLLFEKIEDMDKSGIADAAKSIGKVIKAIASAERTIVRALNEVKKRDTDVKALLKEMNKINVRLGRMDNAEFMIRLSEARRRALRLPRIAVAEKKRVDASIVAIENDIIDLSVIALLRKKKMNGAIIKKSIVAPGKRVDDRIKVLVGQNRIKKERLGRYFVYSVVA